MRLLPVCVFLLAGLAASPGIRTAQADSERPALYADFDNKVAGQLIDTRGATFGEPIGLGTQGGLDASVVETAPGQNVLRVSNDLTSSSARSIEWQMLGDAEINEGEVRISLDLTASALDTYAVNVRESNGAAKVFLSIALLNTGKINLSDAGGQFLGIFNAYAPDVPLRIELIFDMDARTSSVILGNTTVVAGRAFDIPDRGIGSVRIGYGSLSNGSPFDLDNLKISGPLPFPVVLEADFDDKTAGLPIGLGGAQFNEPVVQAANIDAIVGEPAPGVKILDISSTNTSTSQFLRWQFLDNLEVSSDIHVLDFDTQMMTRDRYRISLREPTSSSQPFTNLQFQANGTMGVSDANGTRIFSGVTYQAGQAYQYRIIHDLDAGIYDIFRNGMPLIRERAHGITTRGIGAILYGIDNGALTSAHLQIDSLRVYQSNGEAITSDLEFLQEATTAIENEFVTPTIEVGALNIFGQPVPDGTSVTLEIAQGSGPPGAILTGASRSAFSGVARFTALRFSMPGTYRLIARSYNATRLGNVDIVVEQSDALFADGFELSGDT